MLTREVFGLNKILRDKVDALANLAMDKLAHELVAIDISHLCSYTDVILICHGTSTRQAQAICNHLRQDAKSQLISPPRVEGEELGQWIVMDFDDVVLHIFHLPIRGVYDLEGIWADAPRGRLVANGKDAGIDWPRPRSKKHAS